MRCFIVRELYGNSTGIVREGIERVYVEIGRGQVIFWLVRCIFSLECLQIWKKCSTFALKRYFTREIFVKKSRLGGEH